MGTFFFPPILIDLISFFFSWKASGGFFDGLLRAIFEDEVFFVDNSTIYMPVVKITETYFEEECEDALTVFPIPFNITCDGN